MPIASSIVGTWNLFVDWGDGGTPVASNTITFNADGSWTYGYGGGRWVEVEGMYFFNFSNAAGLVYTANVTRDCVSGIMGYAVAGSNPGSGVWWATKPGAPHAAVAMPKTGPPVEHDFLLGPKRR